MSTAIAQYGLKDDTMRCKSKIIRVFFVSLISISLFLMLSQSTGLAQAATFNIPDGDVAGLIVAINTANANGEADTINLASGGTYTLTAVDNTGWHGPNGLPIITSQIIINGNGATIQRSSAAVTPDFRIFLSSGADFTLNEVTIRGASHGWGGGGLRNVGLGKLLLMNSTVKENRGGDGGGILNYCGAFTVVNSTISHNTSFGGYGGGGILNISSYCVSSATIINSTIFENRADAPSGFQGRGDAIADAFSAQGSVVVKNSVIASPIQGLWNDCYIAAGVLTSLGHNIASDASCGLVGTGDLNSTDPMLGPLADNGGPTPTHALLHGSPAIDSVPITDCTDSYGNTITMDQRGVSRPHGTACDIGSYEAEYEIAVTIDIKPGSFPNSINPKSKGVIPVAILTTETFNAATVDSTTVLFGPSGTEAAPVKSALQDVDGDGDIDMILHFNTQTTGIQCGDTSATLTGETLDGQMIKGADDINTVGCK